ncbi:hypothetical protein MHYP_G00224810 [Metynnis hypsauchen]
MLFLRQPFTDGRLCEFKGGSLCQVDDRSLLSRWKLQLSDYRLSGRLSITHAPLQFHAAEFGFPLTPLRPQHGSVHRNILQVNELAGDLFIPEVPSPGPGVSVPGILSFPQ